MQRLYKSSAPLCLMDEIYAARHGISPGDTVTFPLYRYKYDNTGALFHFIMVGQAAFRKTSTSKFVDIAYDDTGYEQIVGGLRQARSVAALLCAVGLLATLAIVLLLLFFS